MNSLRRREYLKAMGIEIWLSRQLTDAADAHAGPVREGMVEELQSADAAAAETVSAERFVIGPGSGNILLVCARSEEAATALSSDVARSLEGEPVWAWPATGTNAPGMTLAAAIEEHMFERVLIFGPGRAAGTEARQSGIAGAAQVIRAEPIPVLMKNGSARRGLWQQLSASGWSAKLAAND